MLGGFPYPSTTNEEVLEYLLQGKRLNQPPGCADEMYTHTHTLLNHTFAQLSHTYNF